MYVCRMISPIIIAIDGYSSTGKSTFAKVVARELGYIYIDTGALYRAITLLAERFSLISPDNKIDEKGLRTLLYSESRPQITFRTIGPNNLCHTFIAEEDVENEIRSLKISDRVSYIAAIPVVREFVDQILRKLGKSKGVVMDGRDIGTAVFPDAELKIFMTASDEVRAKRRLNEMLSKGEDITYDEVLKNLKARDYIDAHREHHPLTMAEDAILLDNSEMTVADQLVWIKNILDKRDNEGIGRS